MSELVRSPSHTPRILGAKPTPEEIFEEYIRLKRAAKTQDGYARDVLDFFLDRLPRDEMMLQERAGREQVQAWVEYLGKPQSEGGAGLEATTIHRKLSGLRGYLDLCVEDGLLAANPCRSKRLVLPRPPTWRPDLGLTTAQVRAMAQACREDKRELIGLRDLAILSIGFACCLRVSEIAGVSYHDFKLVRGHTHLVIPDAKSRDNEQIEVASTTQQRIEEWLLALGGIHVLRPDKSKRGEARFPVFVSLAPRTRHKRLSISAICKIIKQRGRQAGISSMDVHSHLLRHSGITHLFELGWPLARVQRHARHKDPKTTQLYYDLWSQQRHSASEALGDILEGKTVRRPDFEIG